MSTRPAKASRKLSIDDIPELPGYLTVAAISAKYKVHKGTVFYAIMYQGLFPEGTVYKVGKGKGDAEGERNGRPLILVEEKQADKVFTERAETLKKITPEYTNHLVEWNRRVKEWGHEIGWNETPIRVMGPPTQQLVAAYLGAHPDDPRPEEPEPTETDRAFAQALADWAARVKAWGISSGWKRTRIRPSGMPNQMLVDAYLAEHPEDSRPRKSELARELSRIGDGSDSEESH